MKHTPRIIALLLFLFLVTQFIGLSVSSYYGPQQTILEDGETATTYNLPYGLDPPQDTSPKQNLFSIVVAFILAIGIIFILMKYKIELFLRLWFFFVVVIAISITLNAGLNSLNQASLIAVFLAIPLALIKVFKRDIFTHNLTELLIYPGIAVIFIPLLNVLTAIVLLLLISVYDMYAVWKAGFMQKMAKYQIEKVRVFSGFLIPYIDKSLSEKIKKSRSVKGSKTKSSSIKVPTAILGGGDVVFPIVLSGVVLHSIGLLSAVFVSVGATITLAGLFFASKKGKFYPAMPFITAGCLLGLLVGYLI